MIRFFAAISSFFKKLFGRKAVPLLENRVFFSYPEGHEIDAEENVYYSDSYFLADADEDNPSLATCSLGLAMASFSSNDLKDDLENQAGNAVDFLSKCGFSNIETPSYFSAETRKEGLAFVMASKTLYRGKTPFTLIAIGVRGGNYGKEWSSNMKIGLGDRHEGFALAAKGLRLSFEDYLRRHKAKKEIRVWVCGFSRAAAVTNLFAQDLPLQFDKAIVTDIYAYCFACPNTTRINATAPSSTKNYINPKDPVPFCPAAEWGYSRYGTDYLVNCVLPDDPFATVKLDIAHIFVRQKRFKRELNPDKALFLRDLAEILGNRIGLNDYVREFQEVLEECMSLVDPKLANPYQALGDVVGDAFNYLLDQKGTLSLVRMAYSSKTDWEKALLPAFEYSLKDKPYPLNAEKISKALAIFVYFVRDDIVGRRDFFLTLFDKTNAASIMAEHRPSLYLQALKALDPKFAPQN